MEATDEEQVWAQMQVAKATPARTKGVAHIPHKVLAGKFTRKALPEQRPSITVSSATAGQKRKHDETDDIMEYASTL